MIPLAALFQGFVNSGLMWGLLLAGVPLLIHLLNRQRHRPQPWAAVRFVQAAFKKTRRRVQFENWLLLLLRMVAVALFAFAITRPFTGSDSPLAGLTESRRDLVVVIDGSASTGWRQDVQSVFDAEIERARELAGELDASRGDRVRLILAGSFPRLLSWTGPDKALALLETLTRPTDESLDLAAAFSEIVDLAREDAAGTTSSQLEVRLLTDLQRRSFLPRPKDEAAGLPDDETEAPSVSPLEDSLDRLAELGVRVLVEDLGPGASLSENAGIASVEATGPVLGPGAPVEIAVEVRNYGSRERSSERVVIEVDGERRPNRVVDVPAGESAQVIFPVVFRTAGPHVVRASIEGDGLTIDDSRTRVLEVPAAVRILAVNGSPDPNEVVEDELGLISAVLEPMTGGTGDTPDWLARSPFELREITPGELGQPDLDLYAYDILLLANVQNLSASLADKIAQRVADGGSLILTLGDFVDLSSWNDRLFRPDGTGLLPAELGTVISVAGQRGNYFRVQQFAEDHPILRFYAEERWKNLLIEVPIYQFVAASALEDAKVLAALDDDTAHPLLIERAFDRGKVFLWTTSIDSAWTLLPEIPRSFVPLVHEWMRYAGREEGPQRNLEPGQPITPEANFFPRSATLARPDGTRRDLEGEPEEIAPGRFRLPMIPGKETERTGLYTVETAGGRTLPFAVALDPTEGDLARLAAAELEGLHENLVRVAASGREGDIGPEDSGRDLGELWRWLALFCLLALILESLWAAWIGIRRSRA